MEQTEHALDTSPMVLLYVKIETVKVTFTTKVNLYQVTRSFIFTCRLQFITFCTKISSFDHVKFIYKNYYRQFVSAHFLI